MAPKDLNLQYWRKTGRISTDVEIDEEKLRKYIMKIDPSAKEIEIRVVHKGVEVEFLTKLDVLYLKDLFGPWLNRNRL